MPSPFACPVEATSHVLAGKWKALILWHLSFQTLRFAELRDLLQGVSEKVLGEQLRQLARDGVITRTSTGTQPARVDYALSPAGRELVPVMEQMYAWGVSHLGVAPNLPREPQSPAPGANDGRE